MSDAKDTSDTEQLRAEIDHTRDELTETVEALAAKADVKGRATDKVHEVQETAKARARDLQESAKVHAMAAKSTATVQAQQVAERAKVATGTARTVATEQAQHVAAQAKVVTEQAKVKSQQAKEKTQQQRQDKPWLLPALGGLAGLLTAILVWLRRRTR